jgi:hypothetical protein
LLANGLRKGFEVVLAALIKELKETAAGVGEAGL